MDELVEIFLHIDENSTSAFNYWDDFNECSSSRKIVHWRKILSSELSFIFLY